MVAGSRRVPGEGRRRAGVKAGTAQVLGRARVGAAAGRPVVAAWASSEAVEPSAGLFSPWGTHVVHRSLEVVPALQHQRRDQLSLRW